MSVIVWMCVMCAIVSVYVCTYVCVCMNMQSANYVMGGVCECVVTVAQQYLYLS